MTQNNSNHATGIKEVYNLIILDRSGSMSSIRGQAIAGVNETIGTIRTAGLKNDLPQKVTVTTFCGCSTKDFCRNADPGKVPAMTAADYQPCCSTPLYDAMGRALTAMRETVKNRQDVAVSVTIITDGYENASTHWNASQIKALVELLKADGWLFAYIGANQDVTEVSQSMSIDNAMEFDATPDGTAAMFAEERNSRAGWLHRVKNARAMSADVNSDYFKR